MHILPPGLTRKLPYKRRRLLVRLGLGLIALAVALTIIAFVGSRHFAVLDSKGVIADQQRQLLLFATALSLIIILPVFIMTFHIVRTYRVGATRRATRYTPDWDHDSRLESLWWGIPSLIIVVLSVVAWQSSHSLDPSKPIVADKPPLTVQVVAMRWKWLFIYPEQGIASVNYLRFPVNRPVALRITADAPMNSLWIPQLGGQIYAMSGMSTQLHLMAREPGIYQGSSANLSGEGFAGMRFSAQATSDSDFDSWVRAAAHSHTKLTSDSYEELAKPSSDVVPATYRLADRRLYDTVMMKYMGMHHSGGY